MHNIPAKLYRISHWLYVHKIPIIPGLIKNLLYFLFNMVLPPQVEMGDSVFFRHRGLGIVLHPTCKIGHHVIIFQQVTLGESLPGSGSPIIGDYVVIGAGAKILGDISIGNHCVIGANAVVTHSVPNGCLVAGIPGQIVKTDIRATDYWPVLGETK